MSDVLGEYEYVIIVLVGKSDSGKTAVFEVRSKRGSYLLGKIGWHSAWRQYVFHPMGDTIYSAGCLDDIANFLRISKRITEGKK